MRRRRFLSLAAAFACAPRSAFAGVWQGRALGADVSVSVTGPRAEVDAALAGVPAILEEVEAAFSLYRAGSRLSRLNREGWLRADPIFAQLVAEADRAHWLTGGIFDPTVQPLWQALAHGGDADAARQAIGWHRVGRGREITLGPGQALTFNGIAQGFATDLVRDHLAALGAGRTLVNIGEYQALGGPFRLGLSDPDGGFVGQVSLSDGAVATSSPGALRLGSEGHILAPDGRPALWSTVCLEAKRASLADALSTAAVFLPIDALHALKAEAGLGRIWCVSLDGGVRSL